MLKFKLKSRNSANYSLLYNIYRQGNLSKINTTAEVGEAEYGTQKV